MSTRSGRRWTSIALAMLLVATSAAVTRAADDVTAPVGTLTVGDGSGYSSTLTVTVHVPATDDVGVASMTIHWGDTVLEMAYTASFQITFPYAEYWGVGVTWRDAAGNESSAGTQVIVDTTPPVVSSFRVEEDEDPVDASMRISVNASDEWTPLTHVRFRTGSGAWSPAFDVPPGQSPIVIDWPMLDPAFGGSPIVGARTVSVQVRNAAGVWSAARSQRVDVGFGEVGFEVTGDQRTGHVVTFTPRLPAGAVYPSNAVCYWSLLWGNDQSLYYGERDDTFGLIEFGGAKAMGYCAPWAVTIPWVPYRRFMVSFSAEAADSNIIDASLGASPDEPAFTPGVDSTSRHVTSSNHPLVYVLPEDYELFVGEPATYRAYPVAGETIKSTDVWSVQYIDTPERKYGGTTFTFTPKIAGHITVCWHGGEDRANRLSACFDPPARYRDSSPPNTTVPSARFAPGGSGTKVPVQISWSGTDKGWGIDYYRLERSVNGGAWTKITLPSKTGTAVTHSLAYATSYRYRVRAFDKAGLAGSWDYGATFKPRRVADHDAAIKYTSGWKTVADATAYGGATHESRTGERSVSFTFSGRAIAWIAERGPAFGKARVYVDGVLITTADTGQATNQPRRVAFRKSWSSVGTHKIRIVVSGTTNRPTISLDGFAILR